MSLHTLAHHLQSAGRGDDTVLVHMTPAEVGGLQSLAKASGGSLTINPQTGLPEAGWLSSLLPMIAGGVLMATGVGAPVGAAILGSGASAASAGALGSALLVGGGTTLATGSLQKGLMAGLGAYGGAGLAGGLGAMGAAATPSATASAATEAAKQGVISAAPAGVAGGSAAPTVAATTLPNAATSSIVGATNAANPASFEAIKAGASKVMQPGGLGQLGTAMSEAAPYSKAALYGGMMMQPPQTLSGGKKSPGLIRPYEYERTINPDAGPERGNVWDGPVSSKERDYFNEKWTALQPYAAPGKEYKGGENQFAGVMGRPSLGFAAPSTSTQMPYAGVMGRPVGEQQYRFDPYTGMPIANMATGGAVEQMSAENAVGANAMYPQSQLQTPMYSNPMVQRPMPTNVIGSGLDAPTDPYSGEQRFAGGGLSDLGSYSDGGRLLKGPGDGVSDSIPAVIGNRQPARLANNEFVVPARIVSEIGNGSTEAGAKRLYAMMDRVQAARKKSVGKGKIAVDSKAHKELDRL